MMIKYSKKLRKQWDKRQAACNRRRALWLEPFARTGTGKPAMWAMLLDNGDIEFHRYECELHPCTCPDMRRFKWHEKESDPN